MTKGQFKNYILFIRDHPEFYPFIIKDNSLQTYHAPYTHVLKWRSAGPVYYRLHDDSIHYEHKTEGLAAIHVFEDVIGIHYSDDMGLEILLDQ